jgi:integrase
MAETTVAKRVAIVRRWCAHIGDPFDPSVTWRDVDAFVDASAMRVPRSRYAAISHLHQFYLWALRADHCTSDPTALVIRPRVHPGLPRPAHDTDLTIALAVADPVMRAALMLAAFCGLRCIELSRLQWVDVSIDAIRVHGKGNRDRVLPLPIVVRDALDELSRTGPYVLPWRETDDISPGRRVSVAIRRHFAELGCTTTAHQLRHWCATAAYAATGDLAAVQDYLGHASPATTRIYAQLDPARLRTVADAIALPVTQGIAA